MVSTKEESKKKDEKKPSEKAKKKDVDEKEDMSEEDKKLQDELNLLVERLSESDQSLYKSALETLRTLIRASTMSMTSVPKPLKFMRLHYDKMKEIHSKIIDTDVQKFCADIISVLAMTSDDAFGCLNYRLKGQKEPIGDWGHEYVRHICSEIGEDWKNTEDLSDKVERKNRAEGLLSLTKEVVEHDMKHNAESEACDLLMEIEHLDLLGDFVDEADIQRVSLYLLSCVPFAPEPENTTLVKTVKDLYLKFDRQIEALRCAIMINDVKDIETIFLNCKDPLVQRQMAILLGRHQIYLDLDEDMTNSAELTQINSNANLCQYFHALGRELDIMEPKMPQEIYKIHLEPVRPFGSSAQPDSARVNLADSFVNGFVNTGFGIDKMITGAEDANKWFYKNKEYGMLSAAASQGLIFRWDIDGGLTQCDRFLYVNEDFIKAGTMLAVGIISSGIQDPCDPAAALLMDYVHSEKSTMRIGSILGLGLAYANSKRKTVWEEVDGAVVYELRKVFGDNKSSANFEVKGLTGLALGLICVGTANVEVAMDIFTWLMEKSEQDLKDPNMRFLALGIALIFLGTQEKSEVFVESLKTLSEPFGSMTATLVDACAYAGTGNVLKIQQLLHICSEHYEPPKEDKDKKKDDKKKEDKKEEPKLDLSSQQAVAVLGIALIAMGEDVGSTMCYRMFGHLFRYGEPVIRRAVPLALALTSVSNPQLNVLETLSKFSHDADAETANNAVFALALVGAGTNNARLGAMLRQLAVYHQKDPQAHMLVRIAQGMTHMGKGTMTLNPFHSDRQLMCPAAVAGLLATTFAFLDAKNTVLSHQHYLLYCIVPAMQPRLLITLEHNDEDPEQPLKQVNVSVRVGQAVDAVGQAGKPKTITGFQTHTTPVLLAYGERAELANEEYIPISPYLEGLVILKKNPDYDGK